MTSETIDTLDASTLLASSALCHQIFAKASLHGVGERIADTTVSFLEPCRRDHRAGCG